MVNYWCVTFGLLFLPFIYIEHEVHGRQLEKLTQIQQTPCHRLYEGNRFVLVAIKQKVISSLPLFARYIQYLFLSSHCSPLLASHLVGESMSPMYSCFQAKRETTMPLGSAPRGCSYCIFRFCKSLSLQLCWEWLELALPEDTGYMKGTGMYLAKKGSDGITTCFHHTVLFVLSFQHV